MNFEIKLLLLLLCLAGIFLFAGSETGFVSWNRLKISHLADSGSRRGRWSMFLINNKTLFLSAVLIGCNTCVVGASLFFNNFYQTISASIPFLGRIPSAESWILTPIVVLFCEMLPKSLFRLYSFELTLKFIPFLALWYFLTLPFTWVIAVFTGGRKGSDNDDRTFVTKIREEMVLVAAEGVRTGAIFEASNLIINNVLNLKNSTIDTLKVNLKNVQKDVLLKNNTILDARSCKFTENEIIIYDDGGVTPIGTVSLSDISIVNSSLSLGTFLQPAVVISEDISIGAAFKQILSHRGNLIFLRNKNGEIDSMVRKNAIYTHIFTSKKLNAENFQSGKLISQNS